MVVPTVASMAESKAVKKDAWLVVHSVENWAALMAERLVGS